MKVQIAHGPDAPGIFLIHRETKAQVDIAPMLESMDDQGRLGPYAMLTFRKECKRADLPNAVHLGVFDDYCDRLEAWKVKKHLENFIKEHSHA